MDENHQKRPIIAITGSAGKTTTKELIASILSRRLKILKSKKNLNLPKYTENYAKSILPAHQALVLEYGMLKAGDIRKHCSIIQPNISIITTIGNAHIGNFNSSIVELARAKSEIIEGMDPLGRLYINADDTNSKLLVTDSFKGKIATVGIKEKADYQARNVTYSNVGMNFQVIMDGSIHNFSVPLYGHHNIYNALFSIAVTHQLGFTPKEMQQGFNFSNQILRNSRRLFVYRIANNVQLIDDTWSANPQATKAALDVLENLGKNNNIAVLGNMLELGGYTADGHKEVGEYLAKKKVHTLFTYGDYAKNIADAAIQSGFPKEKVFHFTEINALNMALIRTLTPGTTVLIKGSHSLKMNQTVRYLRSFYK
jgi:UDP-N-acetylmuramoyl-tripeptide--D-alanyl-D-alanine ligase